MTFQESPKFQPFHLEGVRHVAPSDAFDAVHNHDALLIDVREDFEIAESSIPLENVLWFPITEILDHVSKLPQNQDILVICSHGVRSSKVVNLLQIKGFTQAFNVDGGIIEWKKSDLPLIEDKPASGCGCGCGCGCN